MQLAQLWRHPVKAMRGERVEQAELRWSGLAGDRRYAFIRGDDRSRFPYLTGRVLPELLRYVPAFVDPADPHGSPVQVTALDGRSVAVDDPELARRLAAAYGAPVTLVHLGRGLHDASPVSLISESTIANLCAAHGLKPDPRRFRNNLVIRGLEAFGEDALVGRTVQVGQGDAAPRLRVDRRNERCAMITLDPDSQERAPELLRAVAADRQSCVAVYASVVRPGLLRQGEAISLLD